jgi:alpha-beta hydrolase superfamily lysophospholipase
MNHIAKNFVSSAGRAYRSHSWESREGGYRRTAIVVGNGCWSVQAEKRLVSFLLDRGFRVQSLELALGSIQAPRPRLAAFRTAISDFAKEATPVGLPIYILAASFSGIALLPIVEGIQGFAALALLSPVVNLPPPKRSFLSFLLPTVQLGLARADQSGLPELLDGFQAGEAQLRLNKRDLKEAAADFERALEGGLKSPVAAFAGEDDPWLSQAGRQSLASAGVKVFSYPRVKREMAHDRYADNYYADLGSFLDEVEARKKN